MYKIIINVFDVYELMFLIEMDQKLIIAGIVLSLLLIVFVWYTDKKERNQLHDLLDEL